MILHCGLHSGSDRFLCKLCCQYFSVSLETQGGVWEKVYSVVQFEEIGNQMQFRRAQSV